ncbi:formyltransferase family protein [Haliscomenobacter sp.]|uniref:formyltransferase family protein n=1 Tax=Haliscomenobacter sp. TaxID=2717303 RepID=UPI0033651810
MKIFLIFGAGANQCALAQRLHQDIPLAHIAKINIARKGKRKIVRTLVSRTLAFGLHKAWAKMMNHYEDLFVDWPSVSSSVHSSANAENLVTLIERENPDLVLVSGTDLLTGATLDRFSTRVMNLHTGISPYIKGGPNCTNWALALNEFDLIGNTIIWIDPGIDTGSIITTERTPLTGNESLTELHIKVMDHAHDLYCRAVKSFIEGKKLPSVPQNSIGKGRLFYTRDWNSIAMIKASINFKFCYGLFKSRADIQLIKIKD